MLLKHIRSAPLQVIPIHIASTLWKRYVLLSSSIRWGLKFFSTFPLSNLISILLLQLTAQLQTESHSVPYSRLILFNLMIFHACWSRFQDSDLQIVIKLCSSDVTDVYFFRATLSYSRLPYNLFSKCAVHIFPSSASVWSSFPTCLPNCQANPPLPGVRLGATWIFSLPQAEQLHFNVSFFHDNYIRAKIPVSNLSSSFVTFLLLRYRR